MDREHPNITNTARNTVQSAAVADLYFTFGRYLPCERRWSV